MTHMSPITFANLKAASQEDLVNKINSELVSAESAGGLDKPNYFFRAQLLMQEIAERKQNRQAWIMIGCTVAITIMTAVITYGTVCSIH